MRGKTHILDKDNTVICG